MSVSYTHLDVYKRQGLISIYSKKPDFTFGASGEITYGNYDYWRLSGSVTGPITDKVAARLDGVWVKRDGFLRDTTNNTDVNNLSLIHI